MRRPLTPKIAMQFLRADMVDADVAVLTEQTLTWQGEKQKRCTLLSQSFLEDSAFKKEDIGF